MGLRRLGLRPAQAVAGVGQVLARAIWTNDLAFIPFTAYWLWTAVVSVLLLSGRLAVVEADRAGR
ncbi:hypothetical protein [Parafrankia discariae]|uniref:hypothetical protein n=1 Tax=Parafrankia discariae TaxID=365528 RepID=UPI000369F96C|nr:hypothetical protein [Parafrankia discariae]